jgi:short-subunit dehydrogenase
MNLQSSPRSPRPVAVITGISKGIGRAIAHKLVSEGCTLIGCARQQAGLDLLQQEVAGSHPDTPVHLYTADFGVSEQVSDFAAFVHRITPVVDILVNNAGIFRPGTVLEDEPGSLEQMMQVNLFSAYHLTRALAPGMVARGRGHIFNLSSVAGIQAYPGGATYCITKFAMTGFSRSLRAELKESGVKVTTLLPGATWSDSWKGADFPPDRLMDPRDLAELLWATYSLSASATVEDIIIRPQLGDL